MNRPTIEKLFGPTWVDFMSEFAESPEMDKILAELKKQKEAGTTIYPLQQTNIFRCFRETPLDELRVVICGQDVYPRGFATGIGFGVEAEGTPPSLEKIIDAVEKDAYSGLWLDKPSFDKSLVSWCKQGILMFNAGLTLPETTVTDAQGNVKKETGTHIELWAPFANYVVEKLKVVKKNIIYCAWGSVARDTLKGVNIFFDYMPPACNHPSHAARTKTSWQTSHFSTINSIIIANHLGSTIKW
jgi:uracil-DNA glycosylase